MMPYIAGENVTMCIFICRRRVSVCLGVCVRVCVHHTPVLYQNG